MSQKDYFNWAGFGAIALAFIVTILFFGYVVFENPGPLDKQVYNVPVQFTKAMADERLASWRETSEDAVSKGQGLYAVNCAYCHSQSGQDVVLAKAAQGQLSRGSTRIDLYRTIVKGFDGGHRLDYLPEDVRWALVHYIRAGIPNAPKDSSSAWSKFVKQGL